MDQTLSGWVDEEGGQQSGRNPTRFINDKQCGRLITSRLDIPVEGVGYSLPRLQSGRAAG